MPPIEVLKRNVFLGPEFPKHIKDVMEHSLRSQTSASSLVDYPLADDSSWGHDYFFSPKNCLNFRIPEDTKDIERLLEEPPFIDPELLSKFE